MKRILCIIFAAVLLYTLTGCNEQEREELQAIIDKNVQDEVVCTTASYEKYISAVESAQLIKSNPFASADDINKAGEKLEYVINNLQMATKGIYQINYDFILQSNDSVGNEWQNTVILNGHEINSGDTVVAEFNSYITINGSVVEKDKMPDVGSGSIHCILKDSLEKSTKIHVSENCGRYSGNTAIWELSCSIKLIERI